MAVSETVNEPQAGPGVGDGADFVVDQPGGQANFTNEILVQVGSDAGGLLGPGDPQAASRLEPFGQRRELSGQLVPRGEEGQDDVAISAAGGDAGRQVELETGRRVDQRQVAAGLDAELLGERCAGVAGSRD